MDFKLFLFGFLLIFLNLCLNIEAQQSTEESTSVNPQETDYRIEYLLITAPKRFTNCGYKHNGKPIEC
ncbi:hypothetical protein DOY81_011471 [Sarcophaga bullata]|nr:hypothetical protein DOY81_011471 [Sarcophaga bullata]